MMIVSNLNKTLESGLCKIIDFTCMIALGNNDQKGFDCSVVLI